MLQGEIVPKLLLDSGLRNEGINAGAETLATGDRVDEFVELLLTQEPVVASQYVSALRSQGTTLPAIYLDLLTPAARRLGEMWETDEASFADVTIGLCRMHQVLLEFSRCFDETRDADPGGRSALIVPAPGEQHTFGLFVVIEFFRRSGWNCWTGTPEDGDDLRRLADRREFDVVGLSASGDRYVDDLAGHIRRLRNDTRNGDAVIIAGGKAFLDQPGLASEIGADGTATDGERAVRLVNRICRKLGNNGT